MKKYLFFFILYFFSITLSAVEVALTIDDLPIQNPQPKTETPVQIAENILKVLEKHHLSGVYGFINARHSNGVQDKVFKTWVDHHQLLGNHTFSHLNLNKVSAEYYIEDIEKNEPVLQQLMKNQNYKFFRYPFLVTGQKNKEKHDEVFQYLMENNYTIAPVTVNFEDYLWNEAYARCVKQEDEEAIEWLKKSFLDEALRALNDAKKLSQVIYQRDIKLILLIHIETFTANMLDDLLTLYEKNGVQFISLPDALQDHAYHQNEAKYAFSVPNHLYHNPQTKKALDDIFRSINSLPKHELKHLCRNTD